MEANSIKSILGMTETMKELATSVLNNSLVGNQKGIEFFKTSFSFATSERISCFSKQSYEGNEAPRYYKVSKQRSDRCTYF